MGNPRRDSATPYLADILELLVILRTSSDPQSKEYVFEELRKYFAAEKPRTAAKRKAA